MGVIRFASLALVLAVPALADVVSYEGNSFPEQERWERTAVCTPERATSNGWLHQELQIGECGPPPGGDRDTYTRPIDEFNGEQQFFLEFRLTTTGDRSEIAGGAPASAAMFNFFGLDYTVTVASDQVKFFRDTDLPILFIDVEAEVPHTVRVELHNGEPNTFEWYIDGVTVASGVAEGPFPVADARISWRGRAWFLPNETRWDYIRYGTIPVDGSGDFDSDGQVDSEDFYFFQECFSAPDVDAGPGCRFADFDFDTDVDCDDWTAFTQAWTPPDDPPDFTPCAAPPPPVPTASTWSSTLLTLILLTAGATALSRRTPCRSC